MYFIYVIYVYACRAVCRLREGVMDSTTNHQQDKGDSQRERQTDREKGRERERERERERDSVH